MFFISAALMACATAWAQAAAPDLKQQVFDAERAFARTMAERDHAAFTRFVSEQAVFFDGPAVLQGRAAIAQGWKAYFDGAKPPFSWEPDQVEVLADGTLALSTGPVRDENGQWVARFNSIWRQELPGVWRVVFDKGSPLSAQDKKAAGIP